MTLSDRLATLFSPTRRLTGAEAGVLRHGGPLGGLEWVVPRADCQFQRMDFSSIPEKRRAEAATLAIRRAYPEAACRHCFVWVAGVAHAWIWLPDPQALQSDELHWLPESALIAPPENEGVRLLALRRGYEGQIWRQHQLVASQWWPAVPDAAQWGRFLRAAGIAHPDADDVPMAQSLPLRDRTWGEGGAQRRWSPAALERLAWPVTLALSALALGWQLALSLSWQVGELWQSRQLDTLRDRSTPLLEARERAQHDFDTLLHYHYLQAAPSDYVLMAEVMTPLPEDSRFVAWRREGARVQAVVQSAQTDPRVFVTAFQGHPVLLRAEANAGNNGQMMLTFDLQRPEQPSAEPAP